MCIRDSFEIEERCEGVHCVDLGESFPTSIYFLVLVLAKIGVDTAENEPLEVWGGNSIHYSLHSLPTARSGLVSPATNPQSAGRQPRKYPEKSSEDPLESKDPAGSNLEVGSPEFHMLAMKAKCEKLVRRPRTLA